MGNSRSAAVHVVGGQKKKRAVCRIDATQVDKRGVYSETVPLENGVARTTQAQAQAQTQECTQNSLFSSYTYSNRARKPKYEEISNQHHSCICGVYLETASLELSHHVVSRANS